MAIGKVIEYDGFAGKIIDEKGKIFIFTNNDLKDKNITVNSLVRFNPEEYKTEEILEYRARFIKIIDNN